MAKVIAGLFIVACGFMIVATGNVSLLSGQPEALRVGVAALGGVPQLYTALLALPFVLLVWAAATGGRLSLGAGVAWLLYAYFAFAAFSGAVEFANEPLYFNLYALLLFGFVLVLLVEAKVEPVATPAPVAGGSAVPLDPASQRGGGKGRG